jgi:hypothetical protein
VVSAALTASPFLILILGDGVFFVLGRQETAATTRAKERSKNNFPI